MIIDAHQHFWSIARGDYGWLTPESGILWRDYGPEQLAPLIKKANVDRTILVQAAPTEAETSYLLGIAERTPFVAGVVGWTDFAAPDAPARIAALARDPLLVGLRPMVQDIADAGWLARPELAPAFEAMIEHGLTFDALVLPRHLPALLVAIERHPTLKVVVDHAAKPDIARRVFDPWRKDLAKVAAHSHVHCKVSGLVTEAEAGWTVIDLDPVIEHLLKIFGPERLIFGSDWPVVTLRAGYGLWFATSEVLLAELGAMQKAAVYGGNAARLYLEKRGRR